MGERPEVPYPPHRVQAGLAPATTIPELVDACRQDTAGAGARLHSIQYLLGPRDDEAEGSFFDVLRIWAALAPKHGSHRKIVEALLTRIARIEESAEGLKAHLQRLDGKLTLALEEASRPGDQQKWAIKTLTEQVAALEAERDRLLEDSGELVRRADQAAHQRQIVIGQRAIAETARDHYKKLAGELAEASQRALDADNISAKVALADVVANFRESQGERE